MYPYNMNIIQSWIVLVSIQSETAPECPVIFVAVGAQDGQK